MYQTTQTIESLGVLKQDIPSWENKLITINAPMGSGKSHFIKNDLYEYARDNGKRILFLVHRVSCKDQFEYEIIGKEDVISLTTYQAIEAKRIFTGWDSFDFSKYDYIVCDEMHYFLTDSMFNDATDLSLNAILNQLSNNKTIILMSATGNEMMEYLKALKLELLNYYMPSQYEFIRSLKFYRSESVVEKYLVESIEKGEKAIVFMNNTSQALELYNKFKRFSTFNCSQNNKAYKYVDEKEINELLLSQKLPNQLLITTSCIDAGVSIVDEDVKSIYLDIRDINSMIQCLGRKRIVGDEKINVYIKNVGNNRIGGILTLASNTLRPINLLIEDKFEYIKKYGRKSSVGIYSVADEDGEVALCINELIRFKNLFNINLFKDIIKVKDGYAKHISNIFQKGDNYIMLEENIRKENLNDYFENILGEVFLTKADRKELVEKVNTRSNGKLLTTKNSINSTLEELKIPYRVEEFDTRQTIGGIRKRFRHAWRVVKFDDEYKDKYTI